MGYILSRKEVEKLIFIIVHMLRYVIYLAHI